MQKLNFIWEMTEKQWKQLKRDHSTGKTSKLSNHAGFYGSCLIGSLKADIQHTLDKDDWYPFANIFAHGVDTGYATTANDIPYALLNDSPKVPIRSKSFQSFKKNFEKDFETYITADTSTLQLAKNNMPDWELC